MQTILREFSRGCYAKLNKYQPADMQRYLQNSRTVEFNLQKKDE